MMPHSDGEAPASGVYCCEVVLFLFFLRRDGCFMVSINSDDHVSSLHLVLKCCLRWIGCTFSRSALSRSDHHQRTKDNTRGGEGSINLLDRERKELRC